MAEENEIHPIYRYWQASQARAREIEGFEAHLEKSLEHHRQMLHDLTGLDMLAA